MAPFPLFSLPPELRNRIYTHLFALSRPSILDSPATITQTSRRLRHETLALYHHATHLRLQIGIDPASHTLCSAIHTLRQLRRLHAHRLRVSMVLPVGSVQLYVGPHEATCSYHMLQTIMSQLDGIREQVWAMGYRTMEWKFVAPGIEEFTGWHAYVGGLVVHEWMNMLGLDDCVYCEENKLPAVFT